MSAALASIPGQTSTPSGKRKPIAGDADPGLRRRRLADPDPASARPATTKAMQASAYPLTLGRSDNHGGFGRVHGPRADNVHDRHADPGENRGEKRERRQARQHRRAGRESDFFEVSRLTISVWPLREILAAVAVTLSKTRTVRPTIAPNDAFSGAACNDELDSSETSSVLPRSPP